MPKPVQQTLVSAQHLLVIEIVTRRVVAYCDRGFGADRWVTGLSRRVRPI